MAIKIKPPLWFWIVAILLALWEVMGCYACVTQIKFGAAAMGPVDEWSLNYYAVLPVWYNAIYVVATFGGLLGGLALLLRDRRAAPLFWAAFAATVVMFGYAFAATDLIAHKGLAMVLPFPLFIAFVGGMSVYVAQLAEKKKWLRT